jgi:hypothetical protein
MIRAHCKGGAIRVMLQKTTDGRTNEEIWIPLHRDLAPSSGWWAHEPADKAGRKRVDSRAWACGSARPSKRLGSPTRA